MISIAWRKPGNRFISASLPFKEFSISENRDGVVFSGSVPDLSRRRFSLVAKGGVFRQLGSTNLEQRIRKNQSIIRA
jgi:hypothetical protein